MKNISTPLLAGLLAVFAPLSTAAAQEQKSMARQSLTSQNSSVALVASSQSLFELAMRDRDSYMMITAAKLRKKANLREQAMSSEEVGGQPHSGSPQPALLSWNQMLDAAIKYARGNQTVIGLVEDVRAHREKGVVDGAVYSNATIRPRGKRRYSNLSFQGGQYARVYSVGTNDTNLDMYIFNAKGHLICSQTDPSNISQCGWTPPDTGKFTIVMENKSDITSGYSLVTN